MAALGDTFLLPKPGQDTEHLLAAHHRARFGNESSDHGQRDHAASSLGRHNGVLKPGDHPFVHKPSVIFYADARIVDARLLDQLVAQGQFKSHASVKRDVMTRIQNGLEQSPFTPNKIKRAFAEAAKAGLARSDLASPDGE